MPFDSEPSVEVTARANVMRVRDFLDRLPDEQFNMDDYLVWDGPENLYSMPIGRAVNVCGTAACIAGWTQVIFDPDRELDDDLARVALGLTHPQAEALFMPSGDRDKLTRKQAVTVLDHYLATGEIDWSVASQ